MELIRNTVGLLDKRLTKSENDINEVMDYIRLDDINYVSIQNMCRHD